MKTVVDTDADGNGFPDAGETIDYLFTVTNDGNVTLTGVVVTDDMVTVAAGGAISDTAGNDGALGAGGMAPGDVETATGQYTLTQAGRLAIAEDISPYQKSGFLDALDDAAHQIVGRACQ